MQRSESGGGGAAQVDRFGQETETKERHLERRHHFEHNDANGDREGEAHHRPDVLAIVDEAQPEEADDGERDDGVEGREVGGDAADDRDDHDRHHDRDAADQRGLAAVHLAMAVRAVDDLEPTPDRGGRDAQRRRHQREQDVERYHPGSLSRPPPYFEPFGRVEVEGACVCESRLAGPVRVRYQRRP